MTLYELDHGPEDLVQSLYFPDVSGTLECTMWVCFSVGDDDLDGWIDDIDDRSSSAYSWPTQYQGDCDTVDNCERVCCSERSQRALQEGGRHSSPRRNRGLLSRRPVRVGIHSDNVRTARAMKGEEGL